MFSNLLVQGNITKMPGSLAAADAHFLPLQMAVFCAQCELISENNTPRCLACGSVAVLSFSRVLGGSLRGQQTAHLIEDGELDRLVRSLLHTLRHPEVENGIQRRVARGARVFQPASFAAAFGVTAARGD